jgi:hypothetical protein
VGRRRRPDTPGHRFHAAALAFARVTARRAAGTATTVRSYGLVPVGLVLAAIVAVAAGVFEGGEYVIPVVVLVAIVLAFVAFHSTVGAAKKSRYGTVGEAERHGQDAVPYVSVDDARAAGGTPEAHADLNPHDFPPDHPSRPAVEEEAERAQSSPGG